MSRAKDALPFVFCTVLRLFPALRLAAEQALRVALILGPLITIALLGACKSEETGERGLPPAPETEADDSRPSKGARSRPLMVVFTRDYCTPCQVMKPWIGELAAQHPDVDVVTVNLDRKSNEHLGHYFQVSAVPQIVFVDGDGDIEKRFESLTGKERLARAFLELGWAR